MLPTPGSWSRPPPSRDTIPPPAKVPGLGNAISALQHRAPHLDSAAGRDAAVQCPPHLLIDISKAEPTIASTVEAGAITTAIVGALTAAHFGRLEAGTRAATGMHGTCLRLTLPPSPAAIEAMRAAASSQIITVSIGDRITHLPVRLGAAPHAPPGAATVHIKGLQADYCCVGIVGLILQHTGCGGAEVIHEAAAQRPNDEGSRSGEVVAYVDLHGCCTSLSNLPAAITLGSAIVRILVGGEAEMPRSDQSRTGQAAQPPQQQRWYDRAPAAHPYGRPTAPTQQPPAPPQQQQQQQQQSRQQQQPGQDCWQQQRHQQRQQQRQHQQQPMARQQTVPTQRQPTAPPPPNRASPSGTSSSRASTSRASTSRATTSRASPSRASPSRGELMEIDERVQSAPSKYHAPARRDTAPAPAARAEAPTAQAEAPTAQAEAPTAPTGAMGVDGPRQPQRGRSKRAALPAAQPAASTGPSAMEVDPAPAPAPAPRSAAAALPRLRPQTRQQSSVSALTALGAASAAAARALAGPASSSGTAWRTQHAAGGRTRLVGGGLVSGVPVRPGGLAHTLTAACTESRLGRRAAGASWSTREPSPPPAAELLLASYSSRPLADAQAFVKAAASDAGLQGYLSEMRYDDDGFDSRVRVCQSYYDAHQSRSTAAACALAAKLCEHGFKAKGGTHMAPPHKVRVMLDALLCAPGWRSALPARVTAATPTMAALCRLVGAKRSAPIPEAQSPRRSARVSDRKGRTALPAYWLGTAAAAAGKRQRSASRSPSPQRPPPLPSVAIIVQHQLDHPRPTLAAADTRPSSRRRSRSPPQPPIVAAAPESRGGTPQ